MQEKLDAIKEQNSNARAETKLGGYGTWNIKELLQNFLMINMLQLKTMK